MVYSEVEPEIDSHQHHHHHHRHRRHIECVSLPEELLNRCITVSLCLLIPVNILLWITRLCFNTRALVE